MKFKLVLQEDEMTTLRENFVSFVSSHGGTIYESVLNFMHVYILSETPKNTGALCRPNFAVATRAELKQNTLN